jgi:hypothetical protein
MIGFIEGRGDDSGMWAIIGDGEDSPKVIKNDYLEKLAASPEALKRTFEGTPEETSSGDEGRQPVPETGAEASTPPETPADSPAEQPAPPEQENETPAEEAAEPTSEPEATAPDEASDGGTVGDADMESIDDMLAGLEPS